MARIQHTIDDKLKKEAESILRAQGVPPRVATTMLYIEIVRKRSLPFSPSKVPNKISKKAFADSEENKGMLGGFDSADALFNSLEE